MVVPVYKIELLIVDHDGVGLDGIKAMIEEAHYPNHSIGPRVMGWHGTHVDWSDNHPLNGRDTMLESYRYLFGRPDAPR